MKASPSSIVPSRTTLLTITVAALVLLSGCAGLSGDDSDDSTPTVEDGADDGTEMENGDDRETANGNGNGESVSTNSADDATGGNGDDTGDGGDDNGAESGNGNGAESGSSNSAEGDWPSGAGSSAHLDQVPDTAEIVMHFDGSVIDHQTTATLVDGTVAANDEADSLGDLDGFEGIDALDAGDSYRDALDAFEAESGESLDSFNSVTLFGTTAETGTGVAEEDENVGMIVDTEWTWDELTAAAEIDVDEQFQEQRTYSGVDVYINSSNGADPPTWVADPGDGFFIVGQEEQVKAAIDTRQGNQAPLSGPLRDSYESIGDGFVKVAVDVTEQTAGQTADPQVVTMRYGADGSTVLADLAIGTASQEEAEQIALGLEFALANAVDEEAPPEVQEATQALVDSISTSTEGQTAVIQFSMEDERLVEVITTLNEATPRVPTAGAA
jgi:hypothetical protein